MNPTEKQAMVALYRTVRKSMGSADEAAAELVGQTYGIRPSEVLRAVFFDGSEPPRKGPAAATGLRIIARRTA